MWKKTMTEGAEMAKHLLVTGGTGSFGSAFIDRALPFVDGITVYSRDELKQYEMAARLHTDRVRFVIGDIRDKARLAEAMCGCDTVIHAAAMKQVPTCEANPTEAVNTNVDGSLNVAAVAAAFGCKVVALSTDKAAMPANLYGMTKALCDRVFLSMGCAVVRCGNIFGSRGSVVPLFAEQRKTGVVTVTDKRMTRYSITLEDAVAVVARAMRDDAGGQMYVPKMRSYRILDVAEAVAPGCAIKEIGARAGERLHECLVTEAEAADARDLGDCYIIGAGRGDGTVTAQYSNDNAAGWLTVDDIRGML